MTVLHIRVPTVFPMILDIEHGQLLFLLFVAEMLIVGIVLNLIVQMTCLDIVDLLVEGII